MSVQRLSYVLMHRTDRFPIPKDALDSLVEALVLLILVSLVSVMALQDGHTFLPGKFVLHVNVAKECLELRTTELSGFAFALPSRIGEYIARKVVQVGGADVRRRGVVVPGSAGEAVRRWVVLAYRRERLAIVVGCHAV